MPSNPEPTQPLTDDELARIDMICEGGWTPAGLDQGRLWVTLTRHREANRVLEQATIAAVEAKDSLAAEVDRLRAELERVRGQRNQRGQSDGRKAALLVEAREERERALEQRDALAAKLAALDQSGEGQANG
jgi:hypothetical protein